MACSAVEDVSLNSDLVKCIKQRTGVVTFCVQRAQGRQRGIQSLPKIQRRTRRVGVPDVNEDVRNRLARLHINDSEVHKLHASSPNKLVSDSGSALAL